MITTFNKTWQWLRAHNALYWSLACVLGWRAALEVINRLLPLAGHVSEPNALARWAFWDGGWYRDIVTSGYQVLHLASGEQRFAFFPAFPMAVRWLHALVPLNAVFLGLALNLVATWAAVYFLYKIAELVTQQQRLARWGVVCLLAYPFSLFLAAFYADAFLLCGVFGALYFALAKRWAWVLPFALLATSSKSLGLVVVPTLAAIALEQWRSDKQLPTLAKRWAITLAGLGGIGAYMLYLWLKFGDPLLFYKTQTAWGRNHGFFAVNIVRQYGEYLWANPLTHSYYYLVHLFVMAAPVAILGASIWILWRFKAYWPAVLGFCTIALPLSTGNLISLNRYVLVAAPLIPFVLLSMARKRWLYPLLAASALLLVVCATGFLHGTFFAG